MTLCERGFAGVGSTCAWRVTGFGVEIAMTPYRSCAPPPTIWSARDGCCCGDSCDGCFGGDTARSRAEVDVDEVQAAIERLAAAPTEDGLVIREIWLHRLYAGEGAR